ncbi:arylamine N-acetyltransferase family protein [Methylacidiphilum caldifontis]|uniref:Acetyltransferase n=1 Tax=Methylacidiphilum caldifontis TaxID=2795386 RepID=A0A4Y8PBC9_9BACT|nr:arylamine N-acetyltransferase [Methylacidiphilum caldifontis]TFE68176.1 hypothetical protein A7Q10_00610 [Methylacidiphilum caldifontis]
MEDNFFKIDLESYFERIGYKGKSSSPSLDTLFEIHLAHAKSIPFENLDILLGKSISLELQDIEKKLVIGNRGGYCFEQNILFAHVLERLGFKLTRLAARVHYKTNKLLPRTHMSLLVECNGSFWIADVGFGGHGLLWPILLEDNQKSVHFGWQYRVLRQNQHWLLQLFENNSWTSLYSFSLEPQELVDYKIANYYVSTHPDSLFTKTLIVQSLSADLRKFLRNKSLTLINPYFTRTRQLNDNNELLEVLKQDFGLFFAPNTTFRYNED